MSQLSAKLQVPLLKLPFSPPMRHFAIRVLCLQATVGLIACAHPLVQRIIVDAAVSGNRHLVLLTAAIIAGLSLLAFTCNLCLHWCSGVFRKNAVEYLKTAVFRCLLALPENYLQERGAGYYHNRSQTDLNETVSFLCGGGISLWVDFLKLAVAITTVICLNPVVAAITIVFLLPQLLICRHYQKIQRSLSRQLHETTASQRQVMQEYLDNHTAMKTHGGEAAAEGHVRNGIATWGNLFLKRVANENHFSFMLQLPIWLCTGTVTLGGLYFAADGRLSLGTVWALIGLVRIILAPARKLAFLLAPLASAQAAWERISELLAQLPPDESGEPAPDIPIPQGDLSFENVTFGYHTNAPILQNLSFTLPQGGRLFLTGPNGCGKSTALALILKLYAPDSGRLTIGQTDLADLPTAAWRRHIGYLGQTPPFIRGTLRDNLLLGCTTTPSDQQLLQTLADLHADSLLLHHDGALDAPVALNGDNLSGGERLRIALARELLRQTSLLLLDEPAAHLDPLGRQQFYELLSQLPASMTILAVVHDLPQNSTFTICRLTNAENH